MPKIMRTGDDPIWSELITELGDPRPYEATTIDVVTVTDESCVDHDGLVDAYDALDEHEHGYELVVDVLQAETREQLNEGYDAATATIAELFARSSHSLAGAQPTAESPVEATVLVSVSGVLDLLNQTTELT